MPSPRPKPHPPPITRSRLETSLVRPGGIHDRPVTAVKFKVDRARRGINNGLVRAAIESGPRKNAAARRPTSKKATPTPSREKESWPAARAVAIPAWNKFSLFWWTGHRPRINYRRNNTAPFSLYRTALITSPDSRPALAFPSVAETSRV